MKIAAEMVAAGATDQAISDRLGNVSLAGARRHRVNHIERPAKALVEASNKGMAVRAEREQLVAAAEAGELDAAAQFIGLQAVTADLVKVRDRLDRVAEAAEVAGQNQAVAALAAQQHKSAEVRARLGNLGGFAPPKDRTRGGSRIRSDDRLCRRPVRGDQNYGSGRRAADDRHAARRRVGRR